MPKFTEKPTLKKLDQRYKDIIEEMLLQIPESKWVKFQHYILMFEENINLDRLEFLKPILDENLTARKERFYFLAYGEKEGALRYEKYRKSKLQTEEMFLERYGAEEGAKRWKSFREKNSKTNSLEYYIETYGKEEGEIRYKKWRDTCCISKTPSKVSYWLEKGFSEEESILKMKEHQATFTLDKCQEKMGEEEGKKRWSTRQDLWQETMNNKSEEEKKEINSKKDNASLDYFLSKYDDPEEAYEKYVERASKCDSQSLNFFIRKFGDTPEAREKYEAKTRAKSIIFSNPEEDFEGILYYIKFFNDFEEFWKIGITRYNVERRFGKENKFFFKNGLHYQIIFEKKGLFYRNCLKTEQKILKKFSKERFYVKRENFSSGECFKIDVLFGQEIDFTKEEDE